MVKTQVLIIGAGPSGLASLYAFSRVNDPNVEVTCLDKQDSPGGLWNYSWQTGTNEYGLPVHQSLYKCLWSNGPKECLEFPDYTFRQHFGTNIPSFPPREILTDYILGRAKHFNLLNKVKCLHVVENVEPKNGQFYVRYRNLKKSTSHEKVFDHVIVATGHFSVPNIPRDIPNIDNFRGNILHAHNFRSAEQFKDRNLLIVGASYSAEDIGLQCHKYGAKMVNISARNKKMGFKWPTGMREFGRIKNIDKNTITFADGEAHNVDTIILCTGYQYWFPFIHDSIRMTDKVNTMYPEGLYKGVTFINNPNIHYVGMHDQFYTFTMFDIQAFYVRDIITGKIKLPNKKDMSIDALVWLGKKNQCRNEHDQIVFQDSYLKDLNSKCNYVNDWSKIDSCDMFFRWEHHKDEDITTYRNKSFKSINNGDQAPKFKDPWIKVFNYSKEYYCDNNNYLRSKL